MTEERETSEMGFQFCCVCEKKKTRSDIHYWQHHCVIHIIIVCVTQNPSIHATLGGRAYCTAPPPLPGRSDAWSGA